MGTTPERHEDAARSGTAIRSEGGNRSEDGMGVLAYILAGLLFYGGLGWVGDHFLNTSWLLPVGLILGLISGTYLIIKRYGRDT
ncbi:MAG TPA: hypothetical protein PKE40_14630 [Arachnia sp.]|nr:hypothetical protein [Arachnia sp.]HMT87579.1 hypothetical protein [Arachnia sp.]